jgi:hypothetical protein
MDISLLFARQHSTSYPQNPKGAWPLLGFVDKFLNFGGVREGENVDWRLGGALSATITAMK